MGISASGVLSSATHPNLSHLRYCTQLRIMFRTVDGTPPYSSVLLIRLLADSEGLVLDR